MQPLQPKPTERLGKPWQMSPGLSFVRSHAEQGLEKGLAKHLGRHADPQAVVVFGDPFLQNQVCSFKRVKNLLKKGSPGLVILSSSSPWVTERTQERTQLIGQSAQPLPREVLSWRGKTTGTAHISPHNEAKGQNIPTRNRTCLVGVQNHISEDVQHAWPVTQHMLSWLKRWKGGWSIEPTSSIKQMQPTKWPLNLKRHKRLIMTQSYPSEDQELNRIHLRFVGLPWPTGIILELIKTMCTCASPEAHTLNQTAACGPPWSLA